MHLFTREMALSMASSNGLIHRFTTVRRILDSAEKPLLDSSVTVGDVVMLEIWLGRLSQEQRDTLADGEQGEVDTIKLSAPMNQAGTERVSELLEKMYQAIE